jgi:hypothetical protein
MLMNIMNEHGLSNSLKIEIYTGLEQAEEISLVLSELANQINEGGGVIAVEPVSHLMNVKKFSD